MNGVVYIAKGGHKLTDHMKELNYSVSSLKEVHPDLPVTLFTSKDYEAKACNLFDKIIVRDKLADREKQNLLPESPYERTLYIDTDTKIIEPIDSLFGLLDRFDIAACIDHSRKLRKTAAVWSAYDAVPASFSEFAGGVILVRKSAETDSFFELWRRNYKEWCEVSGLQNDQPSFRVSLWQSGLRVFVLPPEFNIRTKGYHNIKPRILHFHNMNDNSARKALENWHKMNPGKRME